MSIATDVVAICDEFRGSPFHSPTVSQITGFVELWNRWIDSAGVSSTVSQLHKITETAILWNCESRSLAELAALRELSRS